MLQPDPEPRSGAGTGWDAIQEQVKKLEKKHALHIAGYGEGNERRLTGKHETSSMDSFRCSLPPSSAVEHHHSSSACLTACPDTPMFSWP